MRISRRKLLISSTLVGGGLLIGFSILRPDRQGLPDALLANLDESFLTGWLKLSLDNRLTIYVPHAEMGQGVHTSLAMMAADEMDADWSLVDVEQAPALDAFSISRRFEARDGFVESYVKDLINLLGPPDRGAGLSQNTVASASVRYTGELVMRTAGAAARRLLIKAAAQQLNVREDELVTTNSTVSHALNSTQLTYGELAKSAARYSIPYAPPLKDPQQFTLIGQPVRRTDIPAMVNGELIYGIDTRPQGCLFAALRLAPVRGGRVERANVEAILNRRGINRVIQLADAVAVVADNYWRANEAVKLLGVDFDAPQQNLVSSLEQHAALRDALHNDAASPVHIAGNVESNLQTTDKVFTATYSVPYLAHGAPEPMNCTVKVNGGTAEVWVGSQDPLATRSRVAELLGIPRQQVTLHPCPLGGAFGRRLPIGWNVIDHAVQIAKEFDVPVKTMVSREEDIRHDYYRPTVVCTMQAGLGQAGEVVNWRQIYTGPSSNPAATSIPYAIESQEISYVPVTHPLPLGSWRSVDFSQHTFFTECFIDELALELGQDPLSFRLSLLVDKPRHRQVLESVAELAGYGAGREDGRGYGVAIQECFGSVVAQIVEVSLSDENSLQVDRVSCAADVGRVVNPDCLSAQLEGGVLFGLSAALREEITIQDGQVQQSNFHDYRVMRFSEVPEISVRVLASNLPPGGAGEAATPQVAPALANAVYDLTGRRLRDLPLLPQF